MARARILLICLGLALCSAAAPASGQTGQTQTSLLVIVNPSNPVGSVDDKFLVDAFLKKATRWHDDKVIRPVDARASAAVRRRFSEEVLRRSVAAVKSYWQQVVFSGRGVPPPELDSDAAVVAYVLKHAGAIGYVSGSAELNGAKVVRVR